MSNGVDASSLAGSLLAPLGRFFETLNKFLGEEIVSVGRGADRRRGATEDETSVFDAMVFDAVRERTPSVAAVIAGALAARTFANAIVVADASDELKSEVLLGAWVQTAHAVVDARGSEGLMRLLPTARSLARRGMERREPVAAITDALRRVAGRITAEPEFGRPTNPALGAVRTWDARYDGRPKMSDRLEDDLMENLTAEPEGRGYGADDFDEAEKYEAYEGDQAGDELADAVTDSLEAEDADEFWGGFDNILEKVGRTGGSVARRVAPIAKMIPISQVQLVGGAADLIGNVLADEGDELDALDAMADYAEEEEDGFDPLSPVVAGLAIRSTLKTKAARIPGVARRQLVKAVSTATKQIARRHGARAVIAAPAILRAARKIVLRKGLTAKSLPGVVNRVAKVALRSPKALRRLVATGTWMRADTRAYEKGIKVTDAEIEVLDIKGDAFHPEWN